MSNHRSACRSTRPRRRPALARSGLGRVVGYGLALGHGEALLTVEGDLLLAGSPAALASYVDSPPAAPPEVWLSAPIEIDRLLGCLGRGQACVMDRQAFLRFRQAATGWPWAVQGLPVWLDALLRTQDGPLIRVSAQSCSCCGETSCAVDPVPLLVELLGEALAGEARPAPGTSRLQSPGSAGGGLAGGGRPVGPGQPVERLRGVLAVSA